jgi:hypothetical protein
MINVKDLQKKYCEARGIQLREEEFSLLATLYPALLVATVDDVFDNEEKAYIADVAVNAALELYDNEEQAEMIADLLFKELLFLCHDKSVWHDKFLTFLAVELNSEDKEQMKQMLFDTAEASKGISTEEKKEIDRIIKYINQ